MTPDRPVHRRASLRAWTSGFLPPDDQAATAGAGIPARLRRSIRSAGSRREPVTRSALVVDVLLGVVVTLLVVAATDPEATLSFDGPRWLGWLIAAAVGAPVAIRRSRPVAGFVVTCVGLVAATSLGMAWGPSALAFTVSPALLLYSLARYVRPWSAVGALVVFGLLAAGAIASTLGTAAAGDAPDLAILFGFVVVCTGAAWVLGWTARQREEYRRRHAEQLVAAAVDAERLRIARELHDIVAHSMSLIAVKAGIAALPAAPDTARTEALQDIADVSRGSLRDMRRLLGALRSDSDGDQDEDALAPVPSVADIPELADRAGAAGIDVTYRPPGDVDLPEDVSLAVYRVVQESLTNVVKHAGPTRCRIEVSADPERVQVSVVDDGPRSRHRPVRLDEPGGHGLIGLRERVTVHGGRFSAGPRPDGGFAVTATLPLGSGESA